MKKTIIIPLLFIFSSLSIQAQAYYQAIGEAMKNKSSYNVTVKDLYGNYSKYQVEVESYNNNRNNNSAPQNNIPDFGGIALAAAKRATELRKNNVSNEYSNRITYLETELIAALRIIQQQQKLIESIAGTSRSTPSTNSNNNALNKYTTTRCFLYRNSDVLSKTILTIEPNTKVKLLGKGLYNENFYKVSFNGKVGYIHMLSFE